MSFGIYHQCCRYIGRSVEIRDRYGDIHLGVVERVTDTHVYFRPLEGDLGGFGYGFGSFGRGFGIGFGAATGALATIVSIAAVPFGFFW
jgi:hypothetical protein